MPETVTSPPPATDPNVTTMDQLMDGLRNLMPTSKPAEAAAEPAAAPAKPLSQPATQPPASAAPASPSVPAATAQDPAPPASDGTPTPLDPVPELRGRSPKAEDWDKAKAARMQLLKERDEFKSKYEQITKIASPDEFQKLKTERDQYQSLLREVAAERDPELTAPIIQKLNDAVALAKSALPADQQEDVLRLLQEPPSDTRDKALEEVMEGLGTIKRGRLEKAMLQIEEAQSERGKLVQRSEQAIAARQQAQAARAQQISKEFETELAEWTSEDKGLEMLRPKDGDAAHNDRAKNIVESSKVLFSGHKLSPREFARAAIRATIAPYLEQQNAALLEERAQLTAEITRLKAGGPGVGASGSGSPAQAANGAEDWSPDSGKTLAQWLMDNAVAKGLIPK